MQGMSTAWYSAFQGSSSAQSSRQKAAILVAVLIFCGFFMVVVGLIEDNLHIRTGGFTICGFGLMAAVCFFCAQYFKKRSRSQSAMRGDESSLTHRVEYIEMILREGQSPDTSNLQHNLSSSRRDINFLLSRILGTLPSYEDVTTNDYDEPRLARAPPPYYTADFTENDDGSTGAYTPSDGNVPPPSYESSVVQGTRANEA